MKTCGKRMRSPGSLDCFWECEAPARHKGLHEWEHGNTLVRFTNRQARRSWRGPAGKIWPEVLQVCFAHVRGFDS